MIQGFITGTGSEQAVKLSFQAFPLGWVWLLAIGPQPVVIFPEALAVVLQQLLVVGDDGHIMKYSKQFKLEALAAYEAGKKSMA